MKPDELLFELREAGLIGENDHVKFRPLKGGVSSDIHLVETSGGPVVVKAALAKLRVRDDWFADISRNAVEQDYLAYAARLAPGSTPKILAANPSVGWFAMEYLGGDFVTWKELLMEGRAQPAHAVRAGKTLGRLHGGSWNDPAARERFATLKNFHELRIDPYLLTAAKRLPAAREELTAEAERLAATELALVHGDYSPKNLLIGPGRLVILDAEVAWFGDPAFDAAFLLTHLHLKALLLAQWREPLLALVPAFWSAYAAELGSHCEGDFEERAIRLLLCLMLARIHGKSPVEYLGESHREFVTEFAVLHLRRRPRDLAALTAAWHEELAKL